MRRTGRGRLLAAAVAGALALAACSGGGGDDGTVWVRAINGDPMTMGLNAQLVTGAIPRTRESAGLRYSQ